MQNLDQGQAGSLLSGEGLLGTGFFPFMLITILLLPGGGRQTVKRSGCSENKFGDPVGTKKWDSP